MEEAGQAIYRENINIEKSKRICVYVAVSVPVRMCVSTT